MRLLLSNLTLKNVDMRSMTRLTLAYLDSSTSQVGFVTLTDSDTKPGRCSKSLQRGSWNYANKQNSIVKFLKT